MKFNSQICTSVEQSKRLLGLGLKHETADMVYQAIGVTPFKKWTEHKIEENFFPAWSLHRLIEMCNKTQFGMTISIYDNEVTVNGDLFEAFDNTYDNLISVIEWLIERGHFNKEYLKQ